MKRKMVSFTLALTLALSLIPTAFAVTTKNKPIYVGDAEVDWMAEETLKLIPLEGKSEKEQVAAIYDWLMLNCSSTGSDGTMYFDESTVSAKGSEMADTSKNLASTGEIVMRLNPEDLMPGYVMNVMQANDTNTSVGGAAYFMFMKRAGQCPEFSSILATLLGHIGVDCRVIPGTFKYANGTTSSHVWDYALIDGQYYWFDPLSDSNLSQNGQPSHQYFMVSDTNAWAQTHDWSNRNFTDWVTANVGEVQKAYGQSSFFAQEGPYSLCSPWAKGYVQKAAEARILPKNYEQVDFTRPVTRQEFVIIATWVYSDLSGYPINAVYINPFPDTNDVQAQFARDMGIIDGINGKFEPDMKLTREQAATILGRVRDLLGISSGATELNFTDAAQISEYARPYVADLVSVGAIAGVGNGQFAPKQEMSIEQAAKIAVEMLGLM